MLCGELAGAGQRLIGERCPHSLSLEIAEDRIRGRYLGLVISIFWIDSVALRQILSMTCVRMSRQS